MVKNPPANAGYMGLILGLGRAHREGNGNPCQYSFFLNQHIVYLFIFGFAGSALLCEDFL